MADLQANGPFIFRDTVFAHGWVRLAPFRWEEERRAVRRVERLPSGRVVELVFTAPEPEALQDRLRVAVAAGDDLSDSDWAAVRERARWMFGLDEELAEFHARCEAVPGLQRAAERRQGRMLRAPTVFEEVIKTLCCVNARWAQSVRMAERLMEQYGEPLPPDPNRRAFPTPAALAAADPRAAQEQCRLGYRADRMVAVARAVAEGAVDLEALRGAELSSEAILDVLRSLPGVGPYAAGHVLCLLGRYEALALDSWVRDTVRTGWFGGQAVSDREIMAAFERFHPHQNLVFRFFDWRGALREEVWHEPLTSRP
jgi:3-methyladenine DNA glycosylase/8-oxoguanine DNA glycosylase